MESSKSEGEYIKRRGEVPTVTVLRKRFLQRGFERWKRYEWS